MRMTARFWTFLGTLIVLGLLLGLTRPAAAAEKPPRGSKSGRSERRDLAEAARHVLSATCGLSLVTPPGREYRIKVNSAGAELLPVLVELVASADFPDDAVDRAAARAVKLPYSQALHDALRKRRNVPNFGESTSGPPMGLCTYFSEHGDTIDYVWLERLRDRLPVEQRTPLAPLLKKMVDRLGG